MDKTTIARPYALAIFQQAQQEDALQSWSDTLDLAVAFVQDRTMAAFLDNPLISRDLLADVMLDISGDRFSKSGRNFIRLLAANDRFAVLPEIAALFHERKAALENWVNVEVISAYPIEADQKQILTQALEKHFGRAVNVTIQLDQDLIGGAIVHIGDVVIDGSLRAGLTQMANELRH